MKTIKIVIVFTMLFTITFSQTFQYSRGWVNGKRSDSGSSNSNNMMLPFAENPLNLQDIAANKFDKDKIDKFFFLHGPCAVHVAMALANQDKYGVLKSKESVEPGEDEKYPRNMKRTMEEII